MVRRIVTERVYLSPLITTDEAIGKYYGFVNNPDLVGFLGKQTSVTSFDEEREWALKAAKDKNYKHFTIVTKDGNHIIGTCSIRITRRSGTIGMLIGDSAYQSKGIGKEVESALIDFCFNELDLHSVNASILADNERSLRCAKSVGFKECGVRHEAEFVHGKWKDVFILEILNPNHKHLK